MAKCQLVLSDDIDDVSVYEYLCKVLQQDKALFLTATQNLKRIRTPKIQLDNDSQIMTFSEFTEKIYEQIRKGPAFLSRADQKFVLTQVIKSLFTGERQLAFYKIRNDLYELFEFMLEQEVFSLDDDILDTIAKDFTESERDIFKIYNGYNEALLTIKSGNLPQNIDISRIKTGRNIKLLSEVYNNNLFKQIDDYNTIIFDGFLFFNDEQTKLLTDAVSKDKNLVFIAKTMKADKEGFLLNSLFKPLEKELNISFDIIELKSQTNENHNAIEFVKNNYLEFRPTGIKIEQGFKFIEPFTSRDRELSYIVNCVSKYIQANCHDDKKSVCNMLANDIAIVIANDKENYEHQLNVILKDNGVFFLDEKSELLDRLDTSLLKKVIYKKNEFVESKIKTKTGKLLNRQEKLVAFKKLYKGINISQKTRSFINYPIGQYILEIYKIVNDSMTCEGFKKILYSNWYYNVGLDTEKYDKYLKEFSYIEPFFRKLKSPAEWIDEINQLITIKPKVQNKNEYRFYSLNCITEESLLFFKNQLEDIKIMVDNLAKVFGDINAHLKALNDNFLLDEIMSNENFTNEFEIEVIKHLKEVIDGINKSNLITNIDSKYFSDNIRNMLMDYEREKSESAANELTLNVVNLENMQKFKLTFFCMCEEDKYPRQYRVNFPFTENIIEILSNPKYGIEHKPNFIKTLDYHIQLEKFLFLNVLDFTKEQMIITQTEEENGKELTNSIYIEDIFSMFNQNIKYTKLKDSQIRTDENYNPLRDVFAEYEDGATIKLEDLCMYFLCPKTYYYLSNQSLKNEISYDNEWKMNLYIPSLIYYKTLFYLGLEGKKNGTVYSVNDDRFLVMLNKLFTNVFDNEVKLFDFLSDFEKKDIRTKVKGQLNNFVNKMIFDKEMLFFRFDLSNTETFKITNGMGKCLNVEIDNCLQIINCNNGYALNHDISSTMDFLVKSAGGETYQFEHFDEILKQLSERNVDDDRMALTSFLFFKLNVQMNSQRFRNDGLQRLKKLSLFINKQKDDNYIPSSYCKYCKFERICKMKERGAL